MAIVKKQFFGQVTGKIGDVVQRNRYGKTVAYMYPSKYKVSQSAQAKEGRSKFALSVAFAKAVNSVQELKQIWKTAKLDGVVAYNRVIKYNRNFISGSRLTVNNIITPEGNKLNINSLDISKTSLSVNFLLFDKGSAPLFNIPLNIYYVLYFYNPKIKPSEELALYSGVENYTSAKDINSSIAEIKFNSTNLASIERYKNLIVYFSVSKTAYKRNEIYWATTYAKEFIL